MAYVLSLPPQSPLKRSFSDNPYLSPCSPLKDALRGPFREVPFRNTSACSLYSFGSNRTASWYGGSENVPYGSSQSLSGTVIASNDFRPKTECGSLPRRSYGGIGRVPRVTPRVPAPSFPNARRNRELQTLVASSSSSDRTSTSEETDVEKSNVAESDILDLYEAIHTPLPAEKAAKVLGHTDIETEQHNSTHLLPVNTKPFRRWVSTLRRRNLTRRKEQGDGDGPLWHDENGGSSTVLLLPTQPPESTRKVSSSMSSSLGGVLAIKSASVTVAGTSIVPHSDTGILGRIRTGNRSSEARRSLDSHGGMLHAAIDERAWLRSVQRRKVVEELIASEESYISDLKVLINDYFTVLTTVPTIPAQTRSSIHENVSQILQLHEDLLSEMHQQVPRTDSAHTAGQEPYPVTKAKHVRFHSADIVPGRFSEHRAARKLRHSLEIIRSPDRRPRAPVVDTETVGNLAKIFNTHMRRFFIYEEYGAHWTTMSQDLTVMCRAFQGWQDYERGVEALQSVVISENSRDSSSRKALTFPDLLIKPIQRVCKYPLLFDDLRRHTPVCDDPEAHAELEKALFRLQETIREVNKAKDDPKTRRLIEVSWRLQDRLHFQEESISRALIFRLLGHVLLCGVLHVTYQTPERIKGQYMVCVLYKSCLVLATVSRYHSPYTVVASIALANGSLEEPNNGRGIQCHTAQHTWKFVFEHGHRLQEIVLSACSPLEEQVWKDHLRKRISCETHDYVEGRSSALDMFSSLSLNLKSMGPVFGHPDSLVRRMSVHRAATVGAKSNMSQVIIKNTQAQKVPDSPPTFSPSMVTRSQSHMSSNHIPTLAPRKSDRIRLESILEDVWTKGILPFPGIASKKNENQIRASANSVIRKLSMASIASNFSRRSPSFSSVSNTRSEDSFGSKTQKMSHGEMRAQSVLEHRPTPAVVDFHNAPAAFLPTDFELKDLRLSTRRRRMVHRDVAIESTTCEKDRPSRPKRVRRLSTHIISMPRCETERQETRRHASPSLSLPEGLDQPSTMISERLQHTFTQKPKRRGSNCKNVPEDVTFSQKLLKSKSKILKFWS